MTGTTATDWLESGCFRPSVVVLILTHDRTTSWYQGGECFLAELILSTPSHHCAERMSRPVEKRPAPSFDAKASRRVHRCVAEWLTLLRKLDSIEMRIIADSSFDIPRMLGCSFGSAGLRA